MDERRSSLINAAHLPLPLAVRRPAPSLSSPLLCVSLDDTRLRDVTFYLLVDGLCYPVK